MGSCTTVTHHKLRCGIGWQSSLGIKSFLHGTCLNIITVAPAVHIWIPAFGHEYMSQHHCRLIWCMNTCLNIIADLSDAWIPAKGWSRVMVTCLHHCWCLKCIYCIYYMPAKERNREEKVDYIRKVDYTYIRRYTVYTEGVLICNHCGYKADIHEIVFTVGINKWDTHELIVITVCISEISMRLWSLWV